MKALLVLLLVFLVACVAVEDKSMQDGVVMDGKKYVSQDPEECTRLMFMCAEGEAFYDETGCGCTVEEVSDEPVGEPGRTECTDEERASEFCIALYQPVCGWMAEHIKCIKYPCAQTYSNRCFACQNLDVGYVTEGECPKEPPVQVTCTEDSRDVEACPDLYEPVCGSGEGASRMYDNRCVACLDEHIESYSEGVCR